jgi:hypothetical protein
MAIDPAIATRRFIASLQQMIYTTIKSNGTWHQGVVNTINTSAKTVTLKSLDGLPATLTCKYLSKSYTPTANDICMVLIQNGSATVFGAY